MQELNIIVRRMRVYKTNIEVPDGMTFKEAIKYAREYINEIPLEKLKHISDSDELDEENCQFKKMSCAISLKELYESGHEHLIYGGRIEHTTEDGKDFYDLYQDEDGLVLCDGECINIINKFRTSVVVENSETGCTIWFSPQEFRIATFSDSILSRYFDQIFLNLH